MSDPICTTGIWVDDETGQVVYAAPEKGTQLVAPGTELDPHARNAVERAGGTIPDDDVEVSSETPDLETTSEPTDAVETATVTTKSVTKKEPKA